MKLLKDMTIFEINTRIEFLAQIRDEIIEYFNDTTPSYTGLERVEGAGARKLRSKINLKINKARLYVVSSGINPYIYYTPPPMIGGRSSDIDLFLNMFSFSIYGLDPRLLTDAIERAAGNYENEKKAARIRTFNPIWWFLKLIKSIASIPFLILKEAGLNTTKFEQSVLGKLVKFIFDIVAFLAALLVILKAFGADEQFINFCKKIFKI